MTAKNRIRGLIVLGALLVLGALDHAILGKERIRRDGEIVYLTLAPVDPRSLMQGDYMALRFGLAQALESRSSAAGEARREGETHLAGITLDPQRVVSLAPAGADVSLHLRYRIRDGRVWLGTNAFFFEEGTAMRFDGAHYGEFRLDRTSGEAVLVGLRDARLRAL